jgi:hypothetical protein
MCFPRPARLGGLGGVELAREQVRGRETLAQQRHNGCSLSHWERAGVRVIRAGALTLTRPAAATKM